MKYQYNIIVIGAGAGGLVASYIGSKLQAKIALIEKDKMGGDCLNYGCVPSKAIINVGKIFKEINDIEKLKKYGIKAQKASLDFVAVMARVQKIIKKIEPHDSVERYQKMGVDCFQGLAKIIDKHTVLVNGKKLTGKNIILATGSSPFIPKIKGIEKIKFLTSDNIWTAFKKKPQKMLIMGGGIVAVELSQAFARLGIDITILIRGEHILSKEDAEVQKMIEEMLVQDKIKIIKKQQIIELSKDKKGEFAFLRGKEKIYFDKLLIATGRKVNIDPAWLKIGLKIENKTIKHNQFLQTNIKNIYLCGDVTGKFQFTHIASYEAWFACLNSLFSPLKKFSINYDLIPYAVFSDPEIARVGLNEKEAKDIAYQKTIYDLKDLDRAIIEDKNQGFVKVLTKKDKILGVTIIGSRASDYIAEFILAKKYNLGMDKILSTIHIYPTFAEANKFAAGKWKEATTPKWIFGMLKRFFIFRR